MREVLKYFAISCEMSPEHRLSVVLVSAPQNVMMRARDDLDRIKLHEPKPLNQLIKIEFPRRGVR